MDLYFVLLLLLFRCALSVGPVKSEAVCLCLVNVHQIVDTGWHAVGVRIVRLLNRGAFASSDDFLSEPGDTMPSVDHIGCLFNVPSSHTLASVCSSTGEPEWARVPVRGPCSSAGTGD